ncbi:MAG TPA: LD-carboxypeptidase [Nocardioides sp.]|nr:LD-carboxypeptidase [Nocardioides sp.]
MTDHQPSRTALRRPPRLRRGDRVALLTPSSPSTLERIDEGIDVLRFCGLEPVEYPTARSRAATHSFLAGTDAERAADLRRALLDDSIAGVLTVGGGYGSQRMLEVLDWSGLDAVAPKVVVGYSDVTALLEALASRLGWASVMGPMVAEGEFRESYSFSSLWSCLASPETYGPLCFADAHTLVGGTAEGLTAGGNLSLLTGSVGTSTSWTPPSGIVLVEDENEDAPRTDIMLTHLRRSGYFANAAAVVAGKFTNLGESSAEEMQLVLDDRLGDLGVPVITGANLGHGGHVHTWPIGVPARLDADARTLTFLGPPLL